MMGPAVTVLLAASLATLISVGESRAWKESSDDFDPHRGRPVDASTVAAPPSRAQPVGEVAIAAEDTDRQDYIRRALNPPLDPTLQGRRGYGGGTGFFVSARDIVTAYHVVAGCAVLTAEFGREGETPAIVTLTESDPAHDLAAVRGGVTTSSPATFEAKPDRVDASDLSVIGFPTHGLRRRTPSITPAAARPAEIIVTNRLLQFSGDIHPGHSGSPLLDEYAAVIGIVTRTINTVSVYRKSGRVVKDVAFAIPNSVILEFLDRHHIPHRLEEPRESLSPEARMERYRDGVVHITCWR